MNSEKQPQPLIIGEVLFDCFSDRRVLGGAPFNVAWNLRGLGLAPLLVSAVGDDPPGREVRRAMNEWGLDDSALQVCPAHATGQVDISLDSGEPSYRFWEDVAYDHIAVPEGVNPDDYGLLYHGSLAFRGPQTRETIHTLRRRSSLPVFVDINVRRPYFKPDWAPALLDGAEHVKLNLDELNMFASADGLEAKDADGSGKWDRRRNIAEQLRQQHSIENIWLTAGEQGAAWVGGGGFEQVDAPPIETMADTVGAGDAFAAVVIQGILQGAEPAESLRRAAAFAARVCGIRGAGVADLNFYHSSGVA